MKILVLTYEFPPVGGGGGRAASHLAREYSSRGHEVVVLTSHYKDLLKDEVRDGYTIKRTFAFRRHVAECSIIELVGYFFSTILSLIRLCRSFSPDIIHLHFGIPCGPLAYLNKFFNKTPYVMTLQGADIYKFDTNKPYSPLKVIVPLTNPVYAAASKVVPVSKGLKKIAEDLYSGIEMQSIPNGVRCDFFRPPAERTKSDKLRIIFFGRFKEEEKGLSYLIKAIKILKDEEVSDRISLKLIGDGPDRQRYEDMIERNGLGDNINILDWMDEGELLKHIQSSDIHVQPSIDEGLPLSVLQSMSCGLPIIATNVCGNVEIVKDGLNGFIVQPRDPESIAEKIRKFTDNKPLIEKMSNESTEIAADYDWGKIAERYLIMFREVVE